MWCLVQRLILRQIISAYRKYCIGVLGADRFRRTVLLSSLQNI